MPLCGGTKTVQRKLVLLYVCPGLGAVLLGARASWDSQTTSVLTLGNAEVTVHAERHRC